MANRSSTSGRPLGISRLRNRDADAVMDAAKRFGSDGRGRDGLRGYIRYLAKDHPCQFVTWINKVVRLELSKRPWRAGVGFRSEDIQGTIGEAITGAMEWLGSDGRGKGGAKGYMTKIGLERPVQHARLLSLAIHIEALENQLPSDNSGNRRQEMRTDEERWFTMEKFSALTLEEKMACYRTFVSTSSPLP
jgi:hypothetical protein